MPPRLPAWLNSASCYSPVLNVAGNPAGVLNVTKEAKEDQALLKDYSVYADICHE